MNLASLPKVPMNYLVPAGNALLLLTFGYSIIVAQREGRKLESCFLGLAVGILGITFSGALISAITQLSDLLANDIKKLGDPYALRKLIGESIQDAAAEPDAQGKTYSVNLPAVVEQLFRTGVWGVASSIADFLFLIAEFFIEVRRDILLSLLQFLFPIIWGFYPLRPDLGTSIVAYILEMALWGPILYLIQILVVYVAPRYLYRKGSLGVPIVALEIVATIMILEIPRVVHQLLSGTLHPGGENAALGMIFLGARAVKSKGIALAGAASSVASTAGSSSTHKRRSK